MGDLWRLLDIDFTTNGIALASGAPNLTYITDTDNIEFAGDIDPIPEPTSLITLAGFFGMGAIGYRFRRRKS